MLRNHFRDVWLGVGGHSGECVATVGLGLSSNSADLCCFCALDYCAPQAEASNGRLRSHHQGIWVASVLAVYLQVWQIGGLFPGGTLNCVAKDFVTLVTKYYLSSENAGSWQPSGTRESLACNQPPLITAPPRPLLTAFLSVSSAVNTVLDKTQMVFYYILSSRWGTSADPVTINTLKISDSSTGKD